MHLYSFFFFFLSQQEKERQWWELLTFKTSRFILQYAPEDGVASPHKLWYHPPSQAKVSDTPPPLYLFKVTYLFINVIFI